MNTGHEPNKSTNECLVVRGLITAIATFQKVGATGGTYFIGFIVTCVAAGFVICALGDFFMLAKVIGLID